MREKRRNMPPQTVPGDDETELFRRTMADARPLVTAPRAAEPRRVEPRARFRRQDDQEVLRESLSQDIEAAEALNGDSLRFHRPAVGKRQFRKLARGGFSIQAELDLHGMTTGEAAEAMRAFVDDCGRRGYTCVRIVHGKGRGSGSRGPVLKRKVDAWLRRWDAVLAFVSARQVDGGTGAVYVLLRKT